MLLGDCSSDVCSSDLMPCRPVRMLLSPSTKKIIFMKIVLSFLSFCLCEGTYPHQYSRRSAKGQEGLPIAPFQDQPRRTEPRWLGETGEIPAAGLAKGRPVLYDRDNNKNLAPLKAREWDRAMGFLNKKPIIKTESFQPLELNEDNVQAIFNRCLATKDSVDFIGATLFTKENIGVQGVQTR